LVGIVLYRKENQVSQWGETLAPAFFKAGAKIQNMCTKIKLLYSKNQR
jgi:hypothetical protein